MKSESSTMLFTFVPAACFKAQEEVLIYSKKIHNTKRTMSDDDVH